MRVCMWCVYVIRVIQVMKFDLPSCTPVKHILHVFLYANDSTAIMIVVL